MQEFLDFVEGLRAIPVVHGLVLVVLWLIAAYVFELVATGVLRFLARRTSNKVDDEVVAILQRPLFYSVILLGASQVAMDAELSEYHLFVFLACAKTFGVFVWAIAGFRLARTVLSFASSQKHGEKRLLQSRTLPVFNLVVNVSTVAAALYFIFLAWKIDLTAWLASAGVLGIALGFAAKDSLANLFAGVFILADAPYKIGDYIVLEGNLRGRVCHIGIRSTRILTRSDIEITIPNSVIGSSTIINEAGGPHVAQRVPIAVSAAYGSDIDLVQSVLLSVPAGVNNVLSTPNPMVRFRRFGGSGLDFELLVWVDDPAARGTVVHELNVRVYKAFAAHHIEIPYSKHDVYIKDFPHPPATQA
jgi:small-conductance mechanosensitive channel